MSGELRQSQKSQLAVAIAQGTSVAKWARATRCPNGRPTGGPTSPKVRAEVESIAAAPSIGRSAGWPSVPPGPSMGSSTLGENAESESVKLSALRAVLSDMMAVSKFAGLEDRVTEIEEQLHARTGNAS